MMIEKKLGRIKDQTPNPRYAMIIDMTPVDTVDMTVILLFSLKLSCMERRAPCTAMNDPKKSKKAFTHTIGQSSGSL